MRNYELLSQLDIEPDVSNVLDAEFPDLVMSRVQNRPRTDLPRWLEQRDLRLSVIGEHGKELALLNKWSIGNAGELLCSEYPLFGKRQFQNTFMLRLRSIGHRLMKACRGSAYFSAPSADVGTLVEIAKALAVGADQLFASLVTRLGGKLHAVIPFEDYERTFASNDLDTYRRLLRQASQIEVLQSVGTDEVAYLAAGKRVVELSDLVFAVWNGSLAKGKGGTADIVEYAARRPPGPF